MKHSLIIGVVALLAVAACSNEAPVPGVVPEVRASSAPTASPPTASPTPTRATTPATLTVQEAAKVYLAGVTPRNEAADKWTTHYDNSASAKTLRADAVRARQAERHFLEVLDKTRWPAAVAKNASSLVECTAEFVSWFDSMSRIKTRSDLTAAPTCGGSDSQLIRARLGLPSSTG
jgi:hypothetical protein